MSSVSGIKAGRAYVAIGADDSELNKVLRKTEQRLNAAAKSIQSIGTKMAAVGGTIAGGLFATAVSAGKLGDHLNDLKAKTGVGAEALAGLDLAASASGSSLDALAGGINKMQRTLAEAAGGSKSANQSLANIGITLDNLQGLKPEQQFELIADRIASITDPTKRTAAAMGIFGRSGTELLPVLTLGAKGLRDFQKQADDLGVTLAYKTANGVGEFDDALVRTKKQIEAVKVTMGAAIASALLPYQDAVAKALKETIEWVAKNPELIKQFGVMALKATAAGVALIALAKALTLVAAAVKAIRLAPLLTGLGGIATILAGLIIYNKLFTDSNFNLSISLDEMTKAQDEARAADLARFKTLKELAGAGKLNDSQMSQAAMIVAQLESNYGALGITIDKTTGQILGMADAWNKVSAAMGAAAKADIKKQIEAIDEEIARVNKAFKENNESAFKLWSPDAAWDNIKSFFAATTQGVPGAMMGRNPFRIPANDPRMKAMKETIATEDKLLAKKRQLRQRLNDIDKGVETALTGGEKPAADVASNIAPIVTALDDVGDAADRSSNQIGQWTKMLELAKKMMSERAGGLDFLASLDIDLARAQGNNELADQLEILRDYKSTLEAIRGQTGLTDIEKQLSVGRAFDIADSRLAELRENLRPIVSGFSAGVVNSNAIGSLNRASKGATTKVETNQQKQIQLAEQTKTLIQQIVDAGGLAFGP